MVCPYCNEGYTDEEVCICQAPHAKPAISEPAADQNVYDDMPFGRKGFEVAIALPYSGA